MLRRISLPATLLVATTIAPAAYARDVLESIMRNDTLSPRDEATIDQEVSQRAKYLSNAGDNLDRRKRARDDLLQSAKNPKAKSVFLNAYAAACQTHLAALVGSAKLESALDAVLVLVELQNAHAVPALTAALASQHPAVRYKAARGVTTLHKDLAKQPAVCQGVISALGVAGAAESDELVLSAIYEALDFSGSVPDFPLAGDCAQALNTIFENRCKQISAGSHDEWKDVAGFAAAGNCHGQAGAAQQSDLMKHLVAFMTNLVERYFEDGARQEYVRKIGQLGEDAESAIHKMMRDANVTPPSNLVSDALRGRPTASRRARAASALEELKSLTSGAPWNLP